MIVVAQHLIQSTLDDGDGYFVREQTLFTHYLTFASEANNGITRTNESLPFYIVQAKKALFTSWFEKGKNGFYRSALSISV